MKNFISMSTLGSYGRFGNQLFQYAALKIYAKQNNLQVEIPEDWIGRKLFIDCHDSPISQKAREQKTFNLEDDCIWCNDEKLEGCDVKGYFQYHTKFYAPYKDCFRSLFKLVPSLETELNTTVKQITGQGTLVGIHIRRGDYSIGKRQTYIAPTQWYLEWLQQNWSKLDNPVLFIASDDIDNVVGDFKEYKPKVFRGKQSLSSEIGFLYDYYILQHCDCLLISNSSFSFTVAMLNEKAKQFYRPDFEQTSQRNLEVHNSNRFMT